MQLLDNILVLTDPSLVSLLLKLYDHDAGIPYLIVQHELVIVAEVGIAVEDVQQVLADVQVLLEVSQSTRDGAQ